MPLRRRYAGNKIVSSIRDVYEDRISRWSDIQEYLPYLHETAKTHRQILELGTRSGNSTTAFLAAIEGTDGHVTSVDMNPCRTLAKHPQWTFLQGSDMDPDVFDRMPSEVDLLFIDTSHYYQHTLDECHLYIPLVRKGGIALFHDTQLFPHPHEYAWNSPVPPVWKALDDYCAEAGLKWVNHRGEYGLGEIRVG